MFSSKNCSTRPARGRNGMATAMNSSVKVYSLKAAAPSLQGYGCSAGRQACKRAAVGARSCSAHAGACHSGNFRGVVAQSGAQSVWLSRCSSPTHLRHWRAACSRPRPAKLVPNMPNQSLQHKLVVHTALTCAAGVGLVQDHAQQATPTNLQSQVQKDATHLRRWRAACSGPRPAGLRRAAAPAARLPAGSRG